MNNTDPVIIDYGLGNLFSVKRALENVGSCPIISRDPKIIIASKLLILPGVGAFKAGMDGLRKYKIIEPLKNSLKHGAKLLGLCLGMQLLFDTSEEFGVHQGLCLIPGKVKLLNKVFKRDHIKIPQVGWNTLIKPKGVNWERTILRDIREKEMVYFVHSFAAYPKDYRNWLAKTEYGGNFFCSVVSHQNILGTQFHPEKSGETGLKILKTFVKK